MPTLENTDFAEAKLKKQDVYFQLNLLFQLAVFL